MTEISGTRLLLEEMKSQIIAELKEHISKEVQQRPTAEKPTMYPGAAQFMSIHENTLYSRIRKGILPPDLIHRVDGTVYFFESELEKFIKNR